MIAEPAAFLRKSREFLAKAQDLLDAHHWPDEAERAAYLAGYHAAQAFLFVSTGKVFKTHRGVRKEFLRLTKDDARFDTELRTFLPRTYNLKSIADYETVPGSRVSP
ncbi:MAG: HEPN domain-containing protein [Beijerinckiaceae bacterium]|nr:HEPN domain-containing protein [Beijerinckiaceae bacterium]